MAHKTIYQFPNDAPAHLSEVGGKGLSLMLASQKRLPVPPGVILSVDFFAPWLEKIKATKAWAEFLKIEPNKTKEVCKRLQHEVIKLTLTKEQLQDLSEQLATLGELTIFAVRSSSPEEDLEGSSFAGGYETILGVTKNHLEDAIRKAFASCLDYRIVVYKSENHFDITDPKIAVIIQQQIVSDIAGVGFSLNPVTNNYDEAVFNANWGLGETVVAGIATPDTYVVDKVTMNIKDRLVGDKQTSIWLTKSGGTMEKPDPRHKQLTLSDEQVITLTKLLKQVEALYQKPIDIEWAFAEDNLYLLQARPITSYVPLSPDMLTQPGEKKRLYLDVTVTAQGMSHPLSKMGTSLFHQLIKIIGRLIWARDITADPTTAIPWISDGKIFANFSNGMRLAGKDKVANVFANMDPLAAEAIRSLDEKVYVSKTPKIKLLPYGLFLRLPGIFIFITRAKHNPLHMHQQIQKSLHAFEQKARDLAEQDITLHELINKLIYNMFLDVFRKTIPMVLTSRILLGEMKKIVGEDNLHVHALERALPHNMTTEMMLALSHVAQLLPDGLDEETFRKKLKAQTLPPEFLVAWEHFLEKYGYRGPGEVDLASPRYRDDPKLLFTIILTLKNTKGENPQEKFDRGQKERREAYEALYQQLLTKNPKQAQQFEKQYQFFETFGGYRETHKYYLILVTGLIRQKVLKIAEKLLDTDRIDTIEQVFELTIDQLDQAMKDPSLDLRILAEKNTVFLKRLARASRAPSVIDSRGFIPSPPVPPAQPGQVVGMPISAGVVRGKIKVLHSPDEKPLHKGEILVARSTDPGWTPLFVNAAGVILEIGGVLQHGALVAREYGLPCVAGIVNATSLWKDGTLVELNGSTGTISIIKE